MANLISFNPPPPIRLKDRVMVAILQSLVTYFNQQFQQISQVVNSQMTLSGTTGQLPAKGIYVGQHYFDTTTMTDKIWNGSAWQ